MKPNLTLLAAVVLGLLSHPLRAGEFTDLQHAVAAPGQGYFPVAIRLADHRIAIIMRGGAPHLGIKGRLDIIFSSDEGKTWSKPAVVVDTPIDDRNPAFGQAADGTLIVAFWRTSRYDDAGRYNDKLDKPVDTMLTRSADGGKTWSAPVPIDVSDIDWGSPFGRIISLPDGKLLMAIYGGAVHKPGEKAPREDHSYVYQSADNGRSWSRLADIAGNGFNETALLRLANGHLLSALRTDAAGEVALSQSQDNGKTWTPARTLTPHAVHPADLTLLPDGRVLLVCGYRVNPFGVCALISNDKAEFEWNQHTLLVDNAASGDCGYPSTVLLNDGRAMTAYYAVGRKGQTEKSAECAIVTYTIADTSKVQARFDDPGNAAILGAQYWTLIHCASPGGEKDARVAVLGAEEPDQTLTMTSIIQKAGGADAYRRRIAVLLKHHSEIVRGFAAVWLGVLGDKRSTPDLLELLKAQDLPVEEKAFAGGDRARAAIGLGLLGATESAPALIELLKSNNEHVRAGAAIGLGYMKATQAADDVAKLLSSREDQTQIAAISSLAEMGAKNYAADVAAILKSDEIDSREAALYALARLHAVNQAKDIAALLEDNYHQSAAAQALALLGADAQAPAIAKALGGSKTLDKGSILLSLGILRAKQFEDQIAKYLDSPDGHIQQCAAWSLILLESQKNLDKTLKLAENSMQIVDLHSIHGVAVIAMPQYQIVFERAKTSFKALGGKEVKPESKSPGE